MNEEVSALVQHSSQGIAEKIEYILDNYYNYNVWHIRQKVLDSFSENKYLGNINKIYSQLLRTLFAL